MLEKAKKLWMDESGQGLSEYALLISFVVALVVLVVQLFRADVVNLFNAIGTFLTDNAPD